MFGGANEVTSIKENPKPKLALELELAFSASLELPLHVDATTH